MAKPKLGTGKSFKAFTEKLETKGYSEKASKAIAAKAGQKKFGATKMSQLAQRGRKRG